MYKLRGNFKFRPKKPDLDNANVGNSLKVTHFRVSIIAIGSVFFI